MKLIFSLLMLFLWAMAQPASAVELPAVPANFEHLDTGFALRGAHEHLLCEQCHVRGIFKGAPRRCMGCHQLATDIEASKKSPNHIPTTQDCDTCHDAFIPNVSWQLVNMNHVGISGGCAGCHNNIFTAGKTAGHLSTTQPCENCHSTTVSWAGARFDHVGVSSGCAKCHNRVTALGKPAKHLPTTQDCSICHTSTVDFGEARMDHQGIASGCAQCHNNVLAPGQKADHIPTVAACEACHDPSRFTSFAGPRMDHAAAGIVNKCQACHEAGNPYGITGRPPPPHLPASAAPDCSSCHLNTRSFLPAFTR